MINTPSSFFLSKMEREKIVVKGINEYLIKLLNINI